MRIASALPIVALLLLAPWPQYMPLEPSSLDDVTEQVFDPGQRATVGQASTNVPSKGMLASAQGLSVADESLGAGELAAFDLFSQFEGVLELSDDFTGGKGRGGKGGTGGRRRAAYEDIQSLRQQKLELYHVAGSPLVYHSFNTSQTVGGKNYLPKVGDQGICSTCVAHAVTAAATASVASTLRVDATGWDISPQSLYYCSVGGKTCASGWQIDAALYELQFTPDIIRPSNCISGNLAEPEIGTWAGVCAQASTACPFQDMSKPWLSCTYKALSSFWQIQQAIRQHGGAVTRITIYDDFRPYFDPARTSLENGIYTPRPGARKLYGHAAVIVGYDNVNQAWTLLNSWGTRSTKDGLFRIAMGQAGVGAPDETYAVICEPKVGTDLDPHDIQPWRRNNRKPVRLVNSEADKFDFKTPCYYYDAVPGDTAASTADAFLVDVRRFAQDNTRVFKPMEVSASYNDSLSSEQVTLILANVKNLQQFPGAIEPYFQCTDGVGMVAECRVGASAQPCTGVFNCTLFYLEPDVSIELANQTLQICNITSAPGQFEAVARFDDPQISEPRALRRFLDAFGYLDVKVPDNYCEQDAWTAAFKLQNPWMHWVRCYVGRVNYINVWWDYPNSARLDKGLVDILLTFEKLELLTLSAAPGSSIPSQLGGLSNLLELRIRSACWGGQLPINLGRDWTSMETMEIEQLLKDPDCGILGTLPPQWGPHLRSLVKITLTNHRISGTLPPEYSLMRELRIMALPHNRLTGKLHQEYSRLKYLTSLALNGNDLSGFLPYGFGGLYRPENIDLSDNNFQGAIPPSWTQLKGTLKHLVLSNNFRLEGCIPLTPYTSVKIDGTQLTGWCAASDSKRDIEQRQADVMRTWLQPVLNQGGKPWDAIDQLETLFVDPVSKVWAGQDGTRQFALLVADRNKSGLIRVTLGIRDSIVYVIGIYAEGADINLTVLPELVSRLPRLERFGCYDCYNTGFLDDRLAMLQLPPSLAAQAPESFAHLELEVVSVRGTLPAEWGSWSSIVTLKFRMTGLTGSLPASWKDMNSLKTLDLHGAEITGTLPPEWGLGGISKASIIDLSTTYMEGTIPASWSTFQGFIFLHSNFHGCIPDQLVTTVYWDRPNIPCSRNSPEVDKLLRVKKLLDPSGQVLTQWTKEDSGVTRQPGVPPGYCHKFQGVKCNQLNEVVALNLSSLAGKGLEVKNKVSLNKLLPIIANFSALQVLDLSGNKALFESSRLETQVLMGLKALQHLDLSDCNLSGPLPLSLAGASSLKHLNLSGNPKLSGSLPEIWAGLTDLQVLDLSGGGISSSLPEVWATMQELKEFRASDNKPGVSGQLPEAWGIMSNLEVLDVSQSRLTGTLPAAWADATALAAKAGDILKAARRHIAEASSAVMVEAATSSDAQLLRAVSAATDAKPTRLRQALKPRGSLKLGMLKLKELGLSDNQLSGQLPKDFAAMKELIRVMLDGNKLTGQLPVDWAALKQLQVLDLSDNQLSSSLPTIWGSLLNLQSLSLAQNLLSGTLPQIWGGMRSLKQLDLSSCSFQGELPVAWIGLKEVRSMRLNGNRLSGRFPLEWSIMANARSHKLRVIDLSDNACMDLAVLQDSISKSGVEANGRVKVNITSVGTGGSGCV